MRESINVYYNGYLKNGFDYDLQVWVENFVIQDCGHPASGINCCNGRKYATVDIRTLESRVINKEV